MSVVKQPATKTSADSMETPDEFIAHVKQAPSGMWIVHSLEDHLTAVAELAATFAAQFGNDDWAYLAGLWHDLGKYSPQFQTYIRTASGLDAHIEGAQGRVDHSTAGAILATTKFQLGRILAYLIAGHHAGLADWQNADDGRSQLSSRVQQKELLERVENVAPSSIIDHALPTSKPPAGTSCALWIRLLFSCLVDADFLDTESFMNIDKSERRSNFPKLQSLQQSFDEFVQNMLAGSKSTLVNKKRKEVLDQCIEKSELPPGVFSLTVPTGGGKTLSSMAFAMHHSVLHSKRRIIYVIPYTSIVEQTASLLRAIFGDCVIEHHSNFEPEKETPQSRLACENWDAPIIVTTNVQFFESLFSNRTSRSRKLHRIVNSTVVLDEAQLLPSDFLQPIVKTMRELARSYGVSFLLSTATQPVLTHTTNAFEGLDQVTEIISDPDTLYTELKRVSVLIPENLNSPTTPEALATSLQQHDQVLCIVNRKDECRELHKLMPAGTIHLSAFMCGEHRSRVINQIKIALAERRPIRVISTQLVEAGVDIDFPIVYRALSGIDSIAQAAGRCNREGLLANGTVHVFVPWRSAPIGHLSHMESATKEILRTQSEDVLLPETARKYFEHLYWMKGTALDKHSICKDLADNKELSHNFKTASRKFKIIEETHSVFVKYLDGSTLIETLRNNGPDRWLLRKMQRYCVSLRPHLFKKLLASGDIEEIHGYFAQAYDSLYHPETGFLGVQTDLIEAESLIVD